MLHFVWIKGLCHKITDLSEQERGRDLSRDQSSLDSGQLLLLLFLFFCKPEYKGQPDPHRDAAKRSNCLKNATRMQHTWQSVLFLLSLQEGL